MFKSLKHKQHFETLILKGSAEELILNMTGLGEHLNI